MLKWQTGLEEGRKGGGGEQPQWLSSLLGFLIDICLVAGDVPVRGRGLDP